MRALTSLAGVEQGGSASHESPVAARRALLAAAAAVRFAPLLAAISFALCWRPEPAGLALGALVTALGTATLAATDLLLIWRFAVRD
ncbi:hypothetical protein ACFYV7_31805 [Nocardia suismassiliense]|uniref:Uncharacterized protein n=1 Tax=Nocardia suismassiliense TaxID=2077092 RepID=A0ABW6R1P1_9NOCA